jgi:glycosyltransferase involved in cell wall biosynthesis
MKIAIDLSALQTQQKAGIEYYTHELVKALIAQDSANEFILLGRDKASLNHFNTSDRVRIIAKNIPGPHTIWMLWAALQTRILNVDCFLSTSNFLMNLLVKKSIQIIYDVTPISHSHFWPKKASKSFAAQLNMAVKNADKFVTISNTTKDNFLSLYPQASDRTFYIGSGLHTWAFEKSDASDVKKITGKFGIKAPYILSVGTIQPRKNYVNMIKAFAQFKERNNDFTYVIVGKDGWMFDDVYTTVNDLGIEDSVIFTKYAEETELKALYDGASAMMFCSFAEGFGLPLLEARARKIPVIASDIPVHREVVDGYGEFCDPNDPSDISKSIESAISNRVMDKKLKQILEEFSWEGVAKRLIEVYSV